MKERKHLAIPGSHNVPQNKCTFNKLWRWERQKIINNQTPPTKNEHKNREKRDESDASEKLHNRVKICGVNQGVACIHGHMNIVLTHFKEHSKWKHKCILINIMHKTKSTHSINTKTISLLYFFFLVPKQFEILNKNCQRW